MARAAAVQCLWVYHCMMLLYVFRQLLCHGTITLQVIEGRSCPRLHSFRNQMVGIVTFVLVRQSYTLTYEA
jgi:hypothetical protein